ncbi:MAG: GLPGLI family protein [Bacteroidota bacterium]
MQKMIFLFFLGIMGNRSLLEAQVADTAFAAARYSFVHISDTTQPDNPFKENTILYLGKNMSNYTNYDRIERAQKAKANAQNKGLSVDIKDIDPSNIKSISINDGVATVTSNNGAVISFVPNPGAVNSYFKDQSALKLSYIASGGGKLFSVEEKIPAIEWIISQETKIIQGMQCQKAVGDFKGRTYEAWFCSQLPYNNGPWKLGGLPGLIIEAYDTKKEVMFNFTSFENAEGEPIAIGVPSDAVKTTPKEFKQYQDAITNGRAGIAGGGGVVVAGYGSRNGAPAPKPRKMNNPIEKETVK